MVTFILGLTKLLVIDGDIKLKLETDKVGDKTSGVTVTGSSKGFNGLYKVIGAFGTNLGLFPEPLSNKIPGAKVKGVNDVDIPYP